MDTSRKPSTPVSETKDFITHSTASSMSISVFVLIFLASKSHRNNTEGPDDTCIYSGLHYRRGTLSLGNLNFFFMVNKYLPFNLERDYLFLPGVLENLCIAAKRDSISIYQGYFYTNIFENIIQNRGQLVSLLTRNV